MPLNTDPISSRIDTYQADLTRLERDFTAAREALHTDFKADIAALVHNGNWQVYPNIPPDGSELSRALNKQVQTIVGKMYGTSTHHAR